MEGFDEGWSTDGIKCVKSYNSHIRHMEVRDGRLVVITDDGVDSFIPELPDTYRQQEADGAQ